MFDKFWRNHTKKNGMNIEWIRFARIVMIIAILVQISQALTFYNYGTEDGYKFSSYGSFIMLLYILLIVSMIVFEIGVWKWKSFAWDAIMIAYVVSVIFNIIVITNNRSDSSNATATLIADFILLYYYGRRKKCFNDVPGYDNIAKKETNQNKTNDVLTTETFSQEVKEKREKTPDLDSMPINNDKLINNKNTCNESKNSKNIIEDKTIDENKQEKQIDTKFCRYCGAKLNSDATFCHKCGKKVM